MRVASLRPDEIGSQGFASAAAEVMQPLMPRNARSTRARKAEQTGSMVPDPNLIAFAALLIWPLVSLVLFHVRQLNSALLWTILGGYLLLPVGTEIKFEGIPKFDKSSIPSIAALMGCLLVGRQPLRFRNGWGIAELLLIAMLVGPFVTSQMNTDPIFVGGRVLPGVGSYDALSSVVGQLLVLMPFFLARQFLRTDRDNEVVLWTLAVAGLAYSLPMLLEVRLSPQLHTWIYGYFPHSFGQQIREGGYRPIVFLGHGLLVAFFIMTSMIAATALWRAGARIATIPAAFVTGYLAAVLVLCKTLGALVYGAALAPVVRLLSPRAQMRIAMVLVAIAIVYPIVRAVDLFPTTEILDAAASVSTDRQESLKFRFDNEDQLLERAWERFWFGWGRYGRNRVYNDETGKDDSVTDGHWIITMGQFGFIGFIAEFGLLGWAVVRAAAASRRLPLGTEAIFLAALALILAVNMIDLLPNSSISPWTWLLAGALLGRAETVLALNRVSARVLPERSWASS